MTLTRPHPRVLITAAVAFLAALAVLTLVHRGPAQPALPPATSLETGPPALTTDQSIAKLQMTIRAGLGGPDAYANLGQAYLQKVRETGDPTFYPKAQGVLDTALARDPHDVGALSGLGALALARHQFRLGLGYGLEAHRVAPDVLQPYFVIVDAEVELGRYRDAQITLQRLVDLRPTLASYARVSYFRELHGDLPGAIRAMQLAVSAGGATPENLAYVQTLLGNLEFDRGHLTAAERDYETAALSFHSYVPAIAGLAQVDAARGELDRAAAAYRYAMNRLPLPQYIVGLGEVELAAGRARQAENDLALVGAEERLLQANGVNTDVDLALFEANHGSPQRAVILARRAWAQAPSVRSADALGWALTRAGDPALGLVWAHRAVRLGSIDPTFLYHAGTSALESGNRAQARRYLERALALNPRFSPLFAPLARQELERAR
ncbi:MAG TPA: tetratricopeptide repeat protein [Solirubrobacteraceae bacterium]|nr:tetratricopeptide repeat protein [Solirubrobacteraceae bacterium]